MKIKHYFCFDKEIQYKMTSEKLNDQNWDILRTDETKSPFAIERSVTEYEKNCEESLEYKRVAERICESIKKNGYQNLVSVGVGKGILEWHIKKMLPELNIECTDYTKESVNLLKNVFLNCDNFRVFDIMKDDYSVFGKDTVIMMYRVSTEFDNKQWCQIFDKLYNAGIENIIFVPTEILNLKIALHEKMWLGINYLRNKRSIFCGWMYSQGEFLRFFKGTNNKRKYIVKRTNIKGNTVMYELRKV